MTPNFTNTINAFFLNQGGEEIQITTSTATFLMRGLVDVDSNPENAADIKISHQTLLLYIDENEVAGKGIARRDEVIVRNQIYSIIEIGNDMNGMAVFRVSKS